MIKEKTGEIYASKKAMAKHEKMEGPKKGTKTLMKVKKKK